MGGPKKQPGMLVIFFIALFLGACSAEEPKAPAIKIGDQAPNFTAVDLHGNRVSMDDYQGKPVILRFWSTECKYCRADTPIFNYYFDKYKDRGLGVVYVNRNSDEQTVRDFVAELDIIFPVVLDRDGSLSRLYNVRVEPQTIIIGADHAILAAILGGISEAELQEMLGDFLTDSDKMQ